MRCESLVSDVFSMFLLGQMFLVLRRVCFNSLIFILSCLQWKCIINDCITHWSWLLYYKWWWFILWDRVTTGLGGQASSWQAFPSVQGVTVQHESALDIYLFTQTRVTQCFASETRDQQVLPPGVSAVPGSFLSSLMAGQSLCMTIWLKNEALYLCVWPLEAVWYVCVGQMACGSNLKWNRTSFVGDIMTYLVWFLDGSCCCHYFPLICAAKWNLFAG